MTLLKNLLVLVFAHAALAADLGINVFRAFNTYEVLPITAPEATAEGWAPAKDSCQPGLGIPYTRGTSKQHPLLIYFTPAGQFTGMGTYVYGKIPTNLVEKGFFLKTFSGVLKRSDEYFVSVQTRRPAHACSTTIITSSVIGDQLVINPNNANFSVPTLEMDARNAKWHRGACWVNMGTNYFYDLKTAPALSWDTGNLVPVVPMYESGKVSGFFFHVPDWQLGLYYTSDWDVLPLPGHAPIYSAMCKNLCGGCQYKEPFSTMHLYFREPSTIQCTVCNETCCVGA